MYRPKYTDVLKAKKRIAPYLNKTPLLEYPGLSKALGFHAYIKHENMQPTGAFKIRGGINLISQLGPEERKKGVITASSGNHGQSIALASKMFGIKATICVPSDVNPDKAEAIESFGAEIIADGRDFDDARLNAIRRDHRPPRGGIPGGRGLTGHEERRPRRRDHSGPGGERSERLPQLEEWQS
jgi:threonine dehydratase